MSGQRRWALIIDPKSPFLGPIDSVKIYGAFVAGYSQLFENPKRILSRIGNGEIRFSSPMPLAEGNFYVFKPMIESEEVDTVVWKRFKKVQYIPLEIAEDALNNGKYSEEQVREIVRNRFSFITTIDIPGVSIERQTNLSNIYYKEAYIPVYKKPCRDESYKKLKLWILVDAPRNYEKEIKSVFKLLGDLGISKKRSAGYGQFTTELREFELNDHAHHMFLSKYVPREDEVKGFPFKHSNYELTEVRGYTKSGRAFGLVRALKEGSTFPNMEKMPVGRVVTYGEEYSIVGVPQIL